MMMMMGLGRPKIRNDGSSPGPRSSSRSIPVPIFLPLLFPSPLFFSSSFIITAPSSLP